MEAKELRIGNLIQDGKGIPFRVEGTESCMIMTTSGGGWFTEKIFEGIPLTEDWLNKFGAKDITNQMDLNKHYVFETKGFTIEFEVASGVVYCFVESIGIDILYIHQLQNLYYALTNSELPIK